MSRPREITAKLKNADLELAAYVIGLEKENLRLQQRIAKFQVETTSKDNQIKALKKQAGRPGAKLVIKGLDTPEKEVQD